MNKHGLYSKAAQIVRGLQQERGTAEQMVAAAKKLGLKDAELQNAGPLPTGKVTRDELAKHFEDKMPKMYVSQYGENPSYMPPGSGKRFMDLQVRSFKSDNPLSPEEERELDQMRKRHGAEPNVITEPSDDEDGGDPADPHYSNYAIPGGKNYRERLLTLGTDKGKPRYNSSHWTDHDNVLAHIRMSDRMVGEDREDVRPIAEKVANHFKVGVRDLGSYAADQAVNDGVISSEEAASLARMMNFRLSKYASRPGIGKKLLHVEELQSDWGQEGREHGFSDPENPYEVFNKKTKEVLSRHPSYSDAWNAYRAIPEDQAADIDTGRSAGPPKAPYVQNTQHWTDLALKNVLREAALGNYDGVVFTPGQAQADRYGLEKQVDKVMYDPGNSTLTAVKDGNPVIKREGVPPENLPGLIGKDISERLLHPDNTFNAGDAENQYHMLQGDDLKMGGEGMKGYYDNIVPKSVMALAKQHDPDVKPGEPIKLSSNEDDYQGFHLPLTDKLKNSVLDKGFPAMRRGGAV